MPPKHLLPIESLRKRTANRVKSGFAGFVRDVRAAGCIAVTQRGKVELVFIDVALYRKVAALVQDNKERS